MPSRRIIVWFRQDLRLHDNEALDNALAHGDEVFPVYVFDERQFHGKTSFGFRKTGRFRARFILESVQDLRNSLRARGLDLIVRMGKPEEEIFKLASELGSRWVFCNMERMRDEAEVQDALEKKLWSKGSELHFFRGKMLYYTQDLPFPVSQTPDQFTAFRKEMEKIVPVRPPLPTPEFFPKWTAMPNVGDMPALKELGHQPFDNDPRSEIGFTGGETAALERLQQYIHGAGSLKTYKETRNRLLGGDNSSKFSPWLALGCLSPKMVFSELKKFESANGFRESVHEMILDLMWRDFFRLMGKKYGNRIFQCNGIANAKMTNPNTDENLFYTWASAHTGEPFIDAIMTELNATGYTSNRGRLNAANWLVKEMNINWQMGAEYFESVLIDYDVCSNYCNWQYIAGVSHEQREDRQINTATQAKQFDPNGEFVKHWLENMVSVR